MLAHGGMANVWLARVQGKLGFQKLFAVKTILPNVADDAVFKTMFLDEARIASRIEHPNVVHMIDVGESSKVAYLVMDLVEGEPLQKLPRACEKLKEKLPLGIVLRILADACHGLHAAHQLCDEHGVTLGVVHRDMSPSNILISAAGVAKVIDFGVAKARDRSTSVTTVGTLKGKISYMPREQALGQEVDRRADTWALGAVLYYLLSGRPPYKEENQLATLQLVMNGAPIPTLPVTLPLSLRTLVAKALAHEPSQRYQTAAEMGETLETLMRKLNVVTTHAQVGTFVQRALGDKLDARKQLVASALAEAANRERARSALAVSIEVDPTEESSSHSGAIIAVPTAVMNVNRLESSSDITGQTIATPEHSTDATRAAFVSAAMDSPRKRVVPILIAGAAVLALVGFVLIAFSMRAANRNDAAKTAAAQPMPLTSSTMARTATDDAPTGTNAAPAAPSVQVPAISRTSEAAASASARPTIKAAAAWPAAPVAAPVAVGLATPAKPAVPAGATPKPKPRVDDGF